MRIKIIFLLCIGFFLSACAGPAYVTAGTGVYYGTHTHSRIAVNLNAGFSTNSSWYVYPWFSAAYAYPQYPRYNSYGGFYWGYNWYGGWGYYPYYQPYYGAPGYWGHHGYGRYGYNNGYRHGYNQGYNGGYNSGYRHGYYDGHYYQGPYRFAHGGNGYAPVPYRYIQPNRGYASQPVRVDNGHAADEHKKKPVHMITRPGHITEPVYTGSRPVVYGGVVRSASGNSSFKGNQAVVVKPHNQPVVVKPHNQHQRAVIVNTNYNPGYRASQAAESGAGHTPPRPSSAYRSASGNKTYKGEAPPVRMHQAGSAGSSKAIVVQEHILIPTAANLAPQKAGHKNYSTSPVSSYQKPSDSHYSAPKSESGSQHKSHSNHESGGSFNNRGHGRSGR